MCEIEEHSTEFLVGGFTYLLTHNKAYNVIKEPTSEDIWHIQYICYRAAA